MRFKPTLLLALATAFLGAGGSCSNSSTGVPYLRETGVEFSADDLWPLVSGQGFYELWLGVPAVTPDPGQEPWEVAQDWTSVVSFRLDGDAKLHDLTGKVLARVPVPDGLNRDAIARATISYQPPADLGVAHPIGMLLCIGDFVASGGTISTDLSWDSPEILPKDLKEPEGEFRLFSATAEDGASLPEGIWFYDSAALASPSLRLGTPLPSAYVYEGWVFQRETTSLLPLQLHSLGRFTSASGVDSDGAGPYAVPGIYSPDFPGQDFVQDLVLTLNDGSWTAMVTIEPETDPAPDVPSSLRILEHQILVTDGVALPIALSNRARNDRLPRAHVTVVR